MTAAGELTTLSFDGGWRHYQELAFAAFEHDRRNGNPKTHIVAPPGSGKTLLGVELIRRLAAPALVLAPNSAIQAQWPIAVAQFAGGDRARAAALAAPDPGAPIACLTYQALCQLQDPGAALDEAASRRWNDERARATGQTLPEVRREVAGLHGQAAQRRSRDLARIEASLKREIARGEHDGVALADLVSRAARERIDALRRTGVRTVVLDECHHLASLWGYIVRMVLEELGDVHVIGLTATPPDDLTGDETALYHELLGDVDFTIPTPAVVREGHLAPYQELAWLTEPLAGETDWLAEHDLRFQELITRLHDEPPEAESDAPPSLPAWVLTRLRVRGGATDEAEVPWASFQRRSPSLARAGVRFLASAGLQLPPGAPRGEAYRQPPDLDDWIVLLEDYALRGLRVDPSPRAGERYDAIAAALRDLGFVLTRRGIRRGASDVDRLLMASAAKPLGLAAVLGCEADARGDALRALVLTDAELATARPDPELAAVIDAQAGTAVAAVTALADDLRTAPLRPLLVSGRGLQCVPRDAPALLSALSAAGGDALSGWRVEEGLGGLVRLRADGEAWQPRTWVALATEVLGAGATQALVGTRALLGEGWNAPCVNCLVDLTAATTSVSVRQMRGRSLRLDPADPAKIASNWDVVCVAPALARGSGDYRRFVGKHRHVFAPCEDGTIEAGPSHVHPSLGPFAPPPAARFDEVNLAMVARAGDHAGARERWRIGRPYAGVELEALLVAPRSRHRRDASAPPAAVERPPRYPTDQRVPLAAAGLTAAAAVVGVVAGEPAALAALAGPPAALTWAGVRLGSTRARLPVAAPLDLVARAVTETYVALGELRPDAAASLALEPRASGYLRCVLHDANAEESRRFTGALDVLLGSVETPRYLISRLVAPPGRSPVALLARTLVRRPPYDTAWHAVPDDLGRNKERAQTLHAAWRRWLGPSELRFTQRTEAARHLLAEAASQAASYETSRRDVWT